MQRKIEDCGPVAPKRPEPHSTDSAVLALKLLLVPSFLILITLAGKRWGPGVAGWLAGLPVSAGPILFIVALEQGSFFAASAAAASLSAVSSTVVFCAVYAHASRRFGWGIALPITAAVWLAAVSLLSHLPGSTALSCGLAASALLAVFLMWAAGHFVWVGAEVQDLQRVLLLALLLLAAAALYFVALWAAGVKLRALLRP